MEEKLTDGMPDMMPLGTVDNPPQKQPQQVPLRMEDQPYDNRDEEDNSRESNKNTSFSQDTDSGCGCKNREDLK